jgi:hypothetical protein
MGGVKNKEIFWSTIGHQCNLEAVLEVGEKLTLSVLKQFVLLLT